MLIGRLAVERVRRGEVRVAGERDPGAAAEREADAGVDARLPEHGRSRRNVHGTASAPARTPSAAGGRVEPLVPAQPAEPCVLEARRTDFPQSLSDRSAGHAPHTSQLISHSSPVAWP